jgi:hypothetical protein
VLFEMLAGRTPFEADTLVSMLLAHVTQPPKRLADCGVSFPQLSQAQALLDSLLAKSPDQRPASAAHVIAAIDALQTQYSQTELRAHTMPIVHPSLPAPASAPLTPLSWDQGPNNPASQRKLWIGASVIAVAAAVLGIGLLWPTQPKLPGPAALSKTVEPETQPSSKPKQPDASGSQAKSAARSHTEVDTPVALDGAVHAPSDTLADVPTAESAASDERELDEELPARSAKARSRAGARSAAGRRAARTRSTRRAKNAASDTEESAHASELSEPESSTPSGGQAVYAPVPAPAAANDDVMRRAPAFPSIAAAKRAHESGKLSTAAYEAAVSGLKARRTRRIAIEQQNLAQGKITAQEYEWRLGRIDHEYRGD